jgi:hypothetical protein
MKSVKLSFERSLAVLGALACLVITALIWRSISANQPMWPLPALYFIELPVVGMIAAGLAWLGGPQAQRVAWGAAGIFLAFSLIGAWSVGFFYLPVALIFTAAAAVVDIKDRQAVLPHLGIFLVAGVGQVVLMLVAIRLVYPGAAF